MEIGPRLCKQASSLRQTQALEALAQRTATVACTTRCPVEASRTAVFQAEIRVHATIIHLSEQILKTLDDRFTGWDLGDNSSASCCCSTAALAQEHSRHSSTKLLLTLAQLQQKQQVMLVPSLTEHTYLSVQHWTLLIRHLSCGSRTRSADDTISNMHICRFTRCLHSKDLDLQAAVSEHGRKGPPVEQLHHCSLVLSLKTHAPKYPLRPGARYVISA